MTCPHQIHEPAGEQCDATDVTVTLFCYLIGGHPDAHWDVIDGHWATRDDGGTVTGLPCSGPLEVTS